MKDKLLRLIDAYIKDDEAINGIASVTRIGPEYISKGVFISDTKLTRKPVINEYVFHENKNVRYDNSDNYSFNIPNIEIKTYDYYDMTFSFENEPPIKIINRSENLRIIKKGFGKKKIFGNFLFSFIFVPYKKVELEFQFYTQKKPIHYLKCGSFEFELSDEEVIEIYNKIEDRRLGIKKAAEMDELNKRFEKYGIN